MNQQYNIGSSDDLELRNSKGCKQLPLALDEPAVRAVVHPTPMFKLDRDAPRKWLQHWMN
jgi:hypothetical protein